VPRPHPDPRRQIRLVAVCAALLAVEPACRAAGQAIGDCPPYRPVSFTAGFARTFRFWYLLDGRVVPLTVSWGCERYELGLFSFGRQNQNIGGRVREVAREDFAASLSRRWFLHRWMNTGVFVGLGGSYRTRAGSSEGDTLNGSHLNFAEQLGVRWMGSGHRLGVEISVRHFSNLGIVLPNIGQNFVEVAVVF
jgi:hypothetical protein